MGSQVNREGLIRAAWEAREKAYAPYSEFAVGAALLTAEGQVFSGCNVENVSLGLTICAERAAASAAIQAGQRDFAAIAIVAETECPIVPCGACRQVLAEFSPVMRVFSEGKGEAREEWNLSELLPLSGQGILGA